MVEFTPAPRPQRPVLEADVEDYFVKRVEALGGEVRKVAWIGRKNAPDRFVMLPGHTPNFWAEIKRPGYVVNAHVEAQVREHDRMRSYDEIVHVIDTFAKADAVLAPYSKGGRR